MRAPPSALRKACGRGEDGEQAAHRAERCTCRDARAKAVGGRRPHPWREQRATERGWAAAPFVCVFNCSFRGVERELSSEVHHAIHPSRLARHPHHIDA
eukprot:7377709-Prymnesium_polylepis.1